MTESESELHEFSDGDTPREDPSAAPVEREEKEEQPPQSDGDGTPGSGEKEEAGDGETKYWKYGLYGCGGSGCLAVVVAFMIGAIGYYYVTSSVSMDSEEVRANAHDIMEFEFPGEERGLIGINFYFDFATVVDNDERMNLVFAVSRYGGELSEKQRRNALRNLNKNFDQGSFTKIDSRSQENMQLCNRSVPLTRVDGRKSVEGNFIPMRRYQTCFIHQGKTFCFMALGRTDDQIDQLSPLLKSIQCPKKSP